MRSLDTRLLAPDDRQELSILASAHLRNRLVDKHDKTAAVTAIRLLHEAASPSATAPPFGLAAAATGTALDLIDYGTESVLSRWLWLAKEAFAAEGGTFERFDLASLSSQVHFALWQKRALLENLDETIGETSEALKLTSGRSYGGEPASGPSQAAKALSLNGFFHVLSVPNSIFGEAFLEARAILITVLEQQPSKFGTGGAEKSPAPLFERIGQSFAIRELVKGVVDAMWANRTWNIEEATEIRIVNFDAAGGGKLGKGQVRGAEVIETPGPSRTRIGQPLAFNTLG